MIIGRDQRSHHVMPLTDTKSWCFADFDYLQAIAEPIECAMKDYTCNIWFQKFSFDRLD